MRLRLPIVFMVAALLTAPVLAGEVIHFTNGGTLEIVGHQVEGEMIHVDLGGGSSMAFPFSAVEEITRSGSSVFNPLSRRSSSNVASSGSFRGGSRSGGGSGTISVASSGSSNSGRGSGARAAAMAMEKFNEMQSGTDLNIGQGVIYPLANHPNRAARKIGVQADMRLYGQAAAQRPRNGSNATMQNANQVNTVTTANGTQIIGGEPPSGKKVHLGVEVYGMGASNRLNTAKVAAGTAGDTHYIPHAVKDD